MDRVKTASTLWRGFAACIDAYEAGIRVATETQFAIARLVEFEPVRSLTATSADLTRDIGAAQVSSARWILDV